MSVCVASRSRCLLLTTGAPASDVTGAPEAESFGGGVLPETKASRHGGEAGPWG